MKNYTANSISTGVNATLALPSYESNITFRILANDTEGASSTSNNFTIQSLWDCTWSVNSDLGSTAGWDENKFIGNITINNTGDSAYSNNNCSLDFRLTYDLPEGKIYFDDVYYKPSSIYTIAAKNNRSIEVKASFGTEIEEENAVITTTESSGRTNTTSTTTTATIVTNKNDFTLTRQYRHLRAAFI